MSGFSWGIPARGRETQALDLLKETTTGYLDGLARDGRIERFDTAILRPQSTELGGFILIQGTQQQIDDLRHDVDFQTWANQVQLVADRVGIVDAWVGEGISDAIGLYEAALRKAGLEPLSQKMARQSNSSANPHQDQSHCDHCELWDVCSFWLCGWPTCYLMGSY